MNDVPRSENGWPTIPPSEFTDLQLAREAHQWVGTARDTWPTQTVSVGEYRKYTNELVKRGLMAKEQQDQFTCPTELDFVRVALARNTRAPGKSRLRCWIGFHKWDDPNGVNRTCLLCSKEQTLSHL